MTPVLFIIGRIKGQIMAKIHGLSQKMCSCFGAISPCGNILPQYIIFDLGLKVSACLSTLISVATVAWNLAAL